MPYYVHRNRLERGRYTIALPLTDSTSPSARAGPDITLVENVENETRRTVILGLGVLLLLAIAFAAYFGIKRTLSDIYTAHLDRLLASEVKGFRLWQSERKRTAVLVAGEPAVTRPAMVLLDADKRGAATCSANDAATLRTALTERLAGRGFAAFEVIERSGRIIAAWSPDYCGRRLNTSKFVGLLERAFRGNTVALTPINERDRLQSPPERPQPGPLAWYATPLRDARGEVMAVALFGELASTGFSRLFAPPGLGETDEFYAFNEQGLMLSEARQIDAAREAGLLIDAKQGGSALNLQLRDPGGNLREGFTPQDARETWPLTRLASHAIAARNNDASVEQHGVLVEPYRNYHGIEVMGAWRWLADEDFGVALEIERGEALQLVKHLDRVFAIVLGLSVAIAVGMLMQLGTALYRQYRIGALTRLGPYRLIKPIGEGGMADVYLGRHALLKRPIAVKILKRKVATDEMIKRFEREVQFASQLNHRNTVAIFDYGHTRGGDFYYVMEYLDGITLSQLVEQHGALAPGRIVHVLRELCSALKEAHGKGLVHRDIKPDNIMVCVRGGEYDVVKILDFGLVKQLDAEPSRELTRQLKVLGTPVYMSPERFSNPAKVDARADVYSVGAVAYLMATGQRLYADVGADDLQHCILHAPVPRPSAAHGETVAPALETFIVECLAKSPDERPRDADALIARLDALAREWPWTQADAKTWWDTHAVAPPGTDEKSAKAG